MSRLDPRPPSPRPPRWLLLPLSLFPALAQAHPGHYHPGEEDEFDAFVAGALHPATGLDHLLLAVALGWLALTLFRRAAVAPLAAFMVALGGGALLGRGSSGGATLEVLIALTLLAAGAAFVFQKGGLAWLAGAAGLAGAIHGFAHGAEAPAGLPFAAYAGGFLLGTVALCGLGCGLAKLSSGFATPAARTAAAVLVAAGALGLFQAI